LQEGTIALFAGTQLLVDSLQFLRAQDNLGLHVLGSAFQGRQLLRLAVATAG
jgi:hypothetical protein